MIEIDWTLIAQIINFLALVFLLNIVLFRPIRRSLKQRQEALAAYEAELGQLSEQGQGMEAQVQENLSAARREGVGRKEAMRQEGAQAEASLLEQVKKEADEQWARMEKKIKDDMAKARKTLKTQAQTFAQSLATKILGREVS